MSKVVYITHKDDKVSTLTFNESNPSHKKEFVNLLYKLANDNEYKRVTIQRV
ncbi:MAG: hypothetical protein KBT34_10625 [Prevotella sp.]|nr:hypothetical protein [Candidatus Prevotella equi]